MTTISVVLLNWNGRNLLEKFLPPLFQYSNNTDIVLADNASSDTSLSFVQEHFPNVKILAFDRNYGFAEGYNKAIELIDSEIIVMLNTDVEVTEEWMKRPLEILEENPQIAVVQPKIRSLSKRTYFEYAGAAGGFIDYLGYPFCRGRIFNCVEEDKGQYDNEGFIFWASGACMFIRRSAYLEVGGFDKHFFAHQEEIDLCWRLKNKGYNIFFTPHSTIYHMGGATLDVADPNKAFLNFRNNRLMLYKNLSEDRRNSILFIRFCLDFIAAFSFLISGKIKEFWAVFRAYLSYRKVKKQCTRSGLSKGPHFSEVYQKSLVVDYYVKRKRKFTTLCPFDINDEK